MGRWVLPLVPVVLGVGLVLFGLDLVGQTTRARLRTQDRYTVDFLDIDCSEPPYQERVDFLSEVQYLASMPGRLRILDEDLPSRLAQAFAGHPWVASVDRVAVAATKRIQVRLTFRKPVLAVELAGQTRAVDRNGILLPKTAVTFRLPLFLGVAKPPAGPAGTPWGDAAVEEAAK